MQLSRGHYIAITSSLIIIIWMISGSLTHGPLEQTKAPVNVSESDLFSVQVERYTASKITPQLIIHGQTAPNRTVHLKAEIAGTVLNVLAREGEFVEKGQVIVEIDPKDKKQQLQQAKALLRQRQVEHEANRSLVGKGLQNKTNLAQSESLLAAAEAQVTALSIAYNAREIKAPFSGVLENRQVEIGSYLRVADPVISVLQFDPYIIKGFVSEKDLALIELGINATGKTIKDQTVTGKIRYISSQANPATRSFLVELEVPNPSGRQADGVTADIMVPLQQTDGIFISPALLSLNDKGILGAKYVSDEQHVIFAPVKLIKSEASGIWVSGLPNPVDLIVVGQSFVSAGEKVNSVLKRPPLTSNELTKHPHKQDLVNKDKSASISNTAKGK